MVITHSCRHALKGIAAVPAVVAPPGGVVAVTDTHACTHTHKGIHVFKAFLEYHARTHCIAHVQMIKIKSNS